MKLLLDEQLPHHLRLEISGHDVVTVTFMSWSGRENGELLQIAADDGFDVLITNDAGFEHEHNLSALPVAVIHLNAEANTLESVRKKIPALLLALENLKHCEFVSLV
jgi:predicted nuclease of predicted toxin-antitoxin system